MPTLRSDDPFVTHRLTSSGCTHAARPGYSTAWQNARTSSSSDYKGTGATRIQLTEMLAFLWQESPELLPTWLAQIAPELGRAVRLLVVETQFVLPSKRRPEHTVLWIPGEAVVLIESKLDADASDHQLHDYATYLLGEPEPTRALIFLTRKPVLEELPAVEGVPSTTSAGRDARHS